MCISSPAFSPSAVGSLSATELPDLNTLARYSFVIASSVYTSCIYIPTHPQAAGGGTGPLPRSTMPATDSAAGARNGEDRISETDAAFGRQSADRQGRRRRVSAGLYRRDAGLAKRCRATRSEEHTSELQSLMRN